MVRLQPWSFTQTEMHMRLRCLGTNVLSLTSEFGSSTRGETDTILKSLLYHTMQTKLKRSAHLVVQSQFIFAGPNPSFSTPWSELQLSAIETDNPTVCLHCPKLTPNWLFFQNLQILSTIASGHDVIHTPASFPICGLLWQLWFFYARA